MAAASRETEFVFDFSGGLNLTRQTQQVDQNSSPDCLNVDFGAKGGFTLRGGFRTQATNAQLATARFIGPSNYQFDTVLIQSSNGSLYEWDGSLSDTTHDVTDDNTERVRGAWFGTQTYFANCWLSSALKVRSWDGTTFRTLPNVFNNNYLSPDASGAGNIPLARQIASHAGYLWVADTVESSVRYSNRVRFSHVQAPENFAAADYFDVGEPGAYDPITQLLPFGSMLLVFKRSGVWALYGNDRDNFQLERLTDASGVCSCGAAATSAGVCYWWSTDGHLMAFNGRGIRVLSEPLRWWSDLGRIQQGGSSRIMFSDGRLYLALTAGSSEAVDNWLFVYDIETNSFTRYNREVTGMLHWSKTGSDGDPLFLEAGNNELLRYDRSYKTDSDTTGDVRIDGYYRTAWLDAKETATKKRWKRPRVTAAADGNCTIRVKVFTDFDEYTPVKQQEFPIAFPASTSLWGTMDWGDNWAAGNVDEVYAFERLPSSGSSRSIQYEFSSFDNVSRWWLDSLAIPFRRKAVR